MHVGVREEPNAAMCGPLHRMQSYQGSIEAFSGVYHWWYRIGLTSNKALLQSAAFLFILSIIFTLGGKFIPAELAWFKNGESRLNHHLSVLFGFGSLSWAGHIIHVALPKSRGIDVNWLNFFSIKPSPHGLTPFFRGQWSNYGMSPDSLNHVWGSSEGAGRAILRFNNSLSPQTQSLWLSDIAHHHVAIGVFFILAGHFYRTNFGIGHSLFKILENHQSQVNHYNLFDRINNSLHFQLGLALAGLGVLSSLTAQHLYFFQPYAFLSNDYTTMAALYTHHQYIAGFLMCGAFVHGAIFFVRDYDPNKNAGNVIGKMLLHKEAIISHLSWVCLFLGFHTLGLYVHNDVMAAFGLLEKQILIEPIFAQKLQSLNLYGYDNTWNHIGPGDFLIHHAIALGLHTTRLILVKGALDARGSRLMPDKKDFGYSFPCDGPGRGGRCDISGIDSFYLAFFWMLNRIGWTTFYWHWKHLAMWGGNIQQFENSSRYIMGWFRDYLWLNSSQLINGYNPTGTNSLGVYAWLFLFAHLIYARGFMFLISWRGYWQELIERLVWSHERTPLANEFVWQDKPAALSIVQARIVGLRHFSVGYVLRYGAFVIASTLGKFG